MPTTSATPWAALSPPAKVLSETNHHPPSYGRAARLTTSRPGSARNRATTTSPGWVGAFFRTTAVSPWRNVGTIDGPDTATHIHRNGDLISTGTR